jgi:hypothetical protein
MRLYRSFNTIELCIGIRAGRLCGGGKCDPDHHAACAAGPARAGRTSHIPVAYGDAGDNGRSFTRAIAAADAIARTYDDHHPGTVAGADRYTFTILSAGADDCPGATARQHPGPSGAFRHNVRHDSHRHSHSDGYGNAIANAYADCFAAAD